MNSLSWSAFFFIAATSVAEGKDSLRELEEKKQVIELQKISALEKATSYKNNIDTLEADLRDRKSQLSKRVASTRIVDNHKWSALMSAKDLIVLERHLRTLRSINGYDLNYIREQVYKADEIKKQRQRLTNEVNQFDNLVKKLKRQEALIIRQEAIERDEIERSNGRSLLLLKGKLAGPVDALTKTSFGLVRSEKNSYALFRNGNTFSSTPGQTVQAVGPGEVIFRDVLKYWGESIMIKHDGDYYSVYVGVRHCLVGLGQKVEMSEKIGESAHGDFYFELWHFKTPVNPKNWIKDLK